MKKFIVILMVFLFSSITYGEEQNVPTCLSGYVSTAGPSFCMDGVKYLLGFPTGFMRLKPSNESVGKALDDVVGKKEMVTACGYTTWGAECSHFQVYSVQPVGEAAKSVEKGL